MDGRTDGRTDPQTEEQYARPALQAGHNKNNTGLPGVFSIVTQILVLKRIIIACSLIYFINSVHNFWKSSL